MKNSLFDNQALKQMNKITQDARKQFQDAIPWVNQPNGINKTKEQLNYFKNSFPVITGSINDLYMKKVMLQSNDIFKHQDSIENQFKALENLKNSQLQKSIKTLTSTIGYPGKKLNKQQSLNVNTIYDAFSNFDSDFINPDVINQNQGSSNARYNENKTVNDTSNIFRNENVDSTKDENRSNESKFSKENGKNNRINKEKTSYPIDYSQSYQLLIYAKFETMINDLMDKLSYANSHKWETFNVTTDLIVRIAFWVGLLKYLIDHH